MKTAQPAKSVRPRRQRQWAKDRAETIKFAPFGLTGEVAAFWVTEVDRLGAVSEMLTQGVPTSLLDPPKIEAYWHENIHFPVGLFGVPAPERPIFLGD